MLVPIEKADRTGFIITLEGNEKIFDLKDFNFRSSYTVLCCRLIGLDYITYLKMCVECFGAKIYGKQGYSYPVFSDEKSCKTLCDSLNLYLSKLESLINKNTCD